VDDGSDDGSTEFVEKFAKDYSRFRIIRNSHTGKAGAVTTGMLSANGDLRLFTDMDQATPIEELDKLLPYFKQGFDVVIGSRPKRKGSPLSRRIVSKGAVVLRKILVGMYELSDTQCGFKMFTNKATEDLFGRINKLHQGFQQISGSSVTAGFDVELLYIAKQMGYSIKEVPVRWLYVETRRVSPIKDSIDGLTNLIKIRANIIQGLYK
jgi:glycosyltransferase involved in cell wall biosynthesis